MNKDWLEGYGGQTTQQLLDMAERYRTDSVVLAFEAGLDCKRDEHGDDALSPEERDVLAIEALEREVNNGGYLQFFENSSGEFAPILVESLLSIGCDEVADISCRAITALGIDGPLTPDAIAEATDDYDTISPVMDAFDQEYYDATDDIAASLLAYIRENAAAIHLP